MRATAALAIPLQRAMAPLLFCVVGAPKAQGGIFGWVSDSKRALAALEPS
jgi:hypothetical protein